MKKIILLSSVLVMSTIACFAGGDWATSAVLIKLTDSTAYYKLNDQGWTDGSWGSSTAFSGLDFGTPDTLMLLGGAGNAWTDDSPGYDTSSFKIYYRVYQTGGTIGDWSVIDLQNEAYNSGNNRIFDEDSANIDLLSLATAEGTHEYTLEVVMSKNQYYEGGYWNSMIPSGQSTEYSADSAGYTAVFTKTNIVTALQENKSERFNIYSTNQSLVIATALAQSQTATIRIVNLAGQVLAKHNTSLSAGPNEIMSISTLERGLYIVTVETSDYRFNKKIFLK